MQSWNYHAENHERIVRHRLDEIALQHCAEGDTLPIEPLETLTIAQIDYLYERIASLRKGPA